jgi:hypothetical protein
VPTRYALMFKFVDGVIVTTYFSVTAIDFATKDGWELVGKGPDDIEEVRQSDEHKWDRLKLKERL